MKRIHPVDFFTGVCLLFCAVIAALMLHDNFVVYPNAFKAWVKQTGNQQSLTYEEWNRLRRLKLLP